MRITTGSTTPRSLSFWTTPPFASANFGFDRRGARADTTASSPSWSTWRRSPFRDFGSGLARTSNALTDHVLGKFEAFELPAVEASVSRAADAAEFGNAHGIEAAMNLYNRKP